MYINRFYFINEKIRADKLRVIDDSGGNLGVITTQEALKVAKEKELDLVLIAPDTDPPVAKILDFNKFLYQEKKKKAQARVKSKKSELKEIKIGPSTGEGDINRYITKIRDYISEGNRVKVTLTMRGRENLFPEIGFGKITRIKNELTEVAKSEDEPKRMGNMIWVIFVKK